MLGAGVAAGTTVAGANAAPNTIGSVAVPKTSPASSWTYTPRTATPIKHLVVIFNENISFELRAELRKRGGRNRAGGCGRHACAVRSVQSVQSVQLSRTGGPSAHSGAVTGVGSMKACRP